MSTLCRPYADLVQSFKIFKHVQTHLSWACTQDALNPDTSWRKTSKDLFIEDLDVKQKVWRAGKCKHRATGSHGIPETRTESAGMTLDWALKAAPQTKSVLLLTLAINLTEILVTSDNIIWKVTFVLKLVESKRQCAKPNSDLWACVAELNIFNLYFVYTQNWAHFISILSSTSIH